VKLTATIVPPSFPAPGAGTAVLTVNAAVDAPLGLYAVVVTGTSGTVNKSIRISITAINPPA
jgi:hypothetical protein